jgi:hypothetical protein
MILRNVSPYCATQCRDTQHQTRYRSMNVRGSDSVTLKDLLITSHCLQIHQAHTHTRTVMKSPAHSSHYLHNPSSIFTCLLGFQNTLHHKYSITFMRPATHSPYHIPKSIHHWEMNQRGGGCGGGPQRCAIQRPTLGTLTPRHTKCIYSMPERALMSTGTILVHPSQVQRHSTWSHPDCDLRIRLTEGVSLMKGRREEMTKATAALRIQQNHAAVFRTKRGTEGNTAGYSQTAEPATQTNYVHST